MPFKDWLQHHKLDLILPLFYETQTSQGYGYLEEVPAYYGRVQLFTSLSPSTPPSPTPAPTALPFLLILLPDARSCPTSSY